MPCHLRRQDGHPGLAPEQRRGQQEGHEEERPAKGDETHGHLKIQSNG